MCEPVTIIAAIGVAITAAEAISQYETQSDMAKNQRESNRAATTDAYKQAGQQEILVNDQAWQKENAEAVKAREAQATSATGAGEAGVSGLSVDALSRSYFTREGQYDEGVTVNRQSDIDRLELQQQGFLNQNVSANNRITQPSAIGLTASLAGAGLSAYDRLSVPTNPSTPTSGNDRFDYVTPKSQQGA
jgi:hypothetical protein